MHHHLVHPDHQIPWLEKTIIHAPDWFWVFMGVFTFLSFLPLCLLATLIVFGFIIASLFFPKEAAMRFAPMFFKEEHNGTSKYSTTYYRKFQ